MYQKFKNSYRKNLKKSGIEGNLTIDVERSIGSDGKSYSKSSTVLTTLSNHFSYLIKNKLKRNIRSLSCFLQCIKFPKSRCRAGGSTVLVCSRGNEG